MNTIDNSCVLWVLWVFMGYSAKCLWSREQPETWPLLFVPLTLGLHKIKTTVLFTLKLHISLNNRQLRSGSNVCFECMQIVACTMSAVLAVSCSPFELSESEPESRVFHLIPPRLLQQPPLLQLTCPSLRWCGLERSQSAIGNPWVLSLSSPLWRLDFHFNESLLSHFPTPTPLHTVGQGV